jgi:E3 ubiquitin-protein ligase DOA10
MRKEFGKWLMDIAKYITTAIILTSVFGDVSQKWVIYIGGVFAVIVTLSWGLYLLKPQDSKNKVNKNIKH